MEWYVELPKLLVKAQPIDGVIPFGTGGGEYAGFTVSLNPIVGADR